MKKIKKIMALLLTAPMLISVAACGGGNSGGGETVDTDKTQLYVAYYNAGYSDRWLSSAKVRFEEMYADYSFEAGKTGVQVIMDPMQQGDVSTVINTHRAEVFFDEHFGMTKMLATGGVENIYTALSTSLGESYGQDINGKALPAYAGETKSVVEKMNTEESSYFLLQENGQEVCYAVPYIDTYNGTLTYNADVFEEKGLYYGVDEDGYYLGAKKSTGEKLAPGPDGVEGTADDGLPRTYDEFFAVCYKMQTACDVIPFVWCGNWTTYVTELANSLFAANIGYTQFKEMLKGEGTIRDYIDGDVEGTYTTKEQAFTADNFTDVYNSEGLYKAVDFLETIVAKEYCNELNVFNGTYSHELAQGDFVLGSSYNGDAQDYGFLVDGTWWYNEAEKFIKKYEELSTESRMNRNLLYMPLPKATEAAWERSKGENVVYSDYSTAIVVKKGLSDMKKLLAETFVRFYCTDESLVEYTTIVSNPRGLTYNMTNDQYNALSPYGKSLYGVHSKTHGYEYFQVTYARDNGNFYKNNSALFDSFMGSLVGGTSYSNVIMAFHDKYDDGLTAEKYFKGILNVSREIK